MLGAGGRPGLAYHAGTLLALELHGIRPADAASITGTSAGAIATGLLAAGGVVEDLAAYSVGATPRDEFSATEALIRAAESRWMRVDVRALLQFVDVRRAFAAANHVRSRRLGPALAVLVPGLVEISKRFAFLDAMTPTPEPSTMWRIVAADAVGRRHVLRSGDAPLSLAVAASCAVPGVFTPIQHNGRRLIDGGMHSTTNADLAIEDDSATVIVLAPMCSRADERDEVDAASEVALAREIAHLRAVGKRVVTFVPSAELRRRMGWNPLAVKRSKEITAAAFLEASDVLSELTPGRRIA